jgi:hypothetical protein
MAYENVRLADGNCCTDDGHLYVYYFQSDLQQVVKKDRSTGSVINTWPVSSSFTDVVSLEFDGYYWWTLEQSPSGFIVKKWDGSTSTAVLVRTFYGSAVLEPFSMSVESYSTTTTSYTFSGSYSIDVDDITGFSIGKSVVVGPSAEVGFEGNYEELDIVGILGNTVSFSTPILSNYGSGITARTTRAFLVFVDSTVKKYDSTTGILISSSLSSTIFSGVTASTFFGGYILFNKSSQIYWLSPSTFTLSKVMAAGNLQSDRSSIITVYDMYAYGTSIYRLQKQFAYYDFGAWYDEVWSTYNTVESITVPQVYSIVLSSEKYDIPAFLSPDTTTVSSTITCEVYDQYYTPVSGRQVDFTTTAGTIIPTQETTDANGICKVKYFSDATVGFVTITAET